MSIFLKQKVILIAIATLFVAFSISSPALAAESEGDVVAAKPWLYFKARTIHSLTFYLQEPIDPEKYGGVDYYEVKYGTKAALPKPKTLIVDADATEFRLTDLKSSQQYYLYITAYFNNGDYSISTGSSKGDTGPNHFQNIRNCVDEQKTYGCANGNILLEDQSFTKPNRPRFLKVKKRKSTSARLRWQKSRESNFFIDYQIKVYQKKKKKKGYKLIHQETLLASQEGDTLNNYIDMAGLKPGKKHYFKVRARLASDLTEDKWSKWSDKRYFKTKKQ